MNTAKDSRLSLVRDQYVLGNIHILKDIYSIIPIGALSVATGISIRRLKNPGSVHISDIYLAASLIKIPSHFLFNVFEMEAPFEETNLDLSEKEKYKLSLLRDSIALGSIRTLPQIFEVIPRSTIAGIIGTNNNNMREFMLNPDPYSLLFIKRVAWALRLTPSILFATIDNYLNERKGRKPAKVKLGKLKLGKNENAISYMEPRKV